MATTKMGPPKDEPRTTTNLGTPAGEPINPAIDPSKTAEERLAALDKQHKEMAKRQERGESPD